MRDVPLVAAIAEDYGLLVAGASAVEARLVRGIILQLFRNLLQTLRGLSMRENMKRKKRVVETNVRQKKRRIEKKKIETSHRVRV